MRVHTRSRFWPKQPRVDVLCFAEMDLAADFSDDSDTVGTTQVGCGKLVQRQQESGKRPARLLAAARAREALAAKRTAPSSQPWFGSAAVDRCSGSTAQAWQPALQENSV